MLEGYVGVNEFIGEEAPRDGARCVVKRRTAIS
jgi:hypothetical protein